MLRAPVLDLPGSCVIEINVYFFCLISLVFPCINCVAIMSNDSRVGVEACRCGPREIICLYYLYPRPLFV